MPIEKSNIKINNSNYFEALTLEEQPNFHVVTEDEASDPGKIAMRFGYTHEQFKIIIRYNGIIDSFNEITPGLTLRLPAMGDIQKLKKI